MRPSPMNAEFFSLLEVEPQTQLYDARVTGEGDIRPIELIGPCRYQTQHACLAYRLHAVD